MMNKYIKSVTVFLVSLLVTSCNDFLDVNPDRRADLDSKEKIDKILVSAYPGSSFVVLTELASDNIDDLGADVNWANKDYNLFYWNDVDEISQDTPQYLWEDLYSVIANANAALAAIDRISKNGDLFAERGEALVARAYAHFVLVNIFARHYNTETSENDLGVVYMEKSETTLDPKYKRESVAEVYRKIERDLLEGLPLIDDNLYKQPKYHFNKAAANAFAARFYLYYGKWDKAEEYANVVLPENPAGILKDYKDLGSGKYNNFTEVPKEYVSGKRVANLLVSEVVSSKYDNFFFDRIGVGLRFHHHSLIANTETIRVASFYGEGDRNYHLGIWSTIAPYNYTAFYTLPDFYSSYPRSAEVLFSTDETLLVRAEARAMQKKYDLAAQDLDIWAKNFCEVTNDVSVESINKFYDNLPYYTDEIPTQKKKLNPKFTVETGTQENMIHAVLHCRRVMTLHEGLRWFDVKRYGIEISRRVLGKDGTVISEIKDHLTKDDPRRAMQIPQNVISAGLEANPR